MGFVTEHVRTLNALGGGCCGVTDLCGTTAAAVTRKGRGLFGWAGGRMGRDRRRRVCNYLWTRCRRVCERRDALDVDEERVTPMTDLDRKGF